QPLRKNLRPLLEEEGYVVEISKDAHEADARARRANHDVILLGLMSTENSLTHVQHWRRAGINAHIVVLLFGGKLSERVRCLDTGADGYLPMPIQHEELLARLRALARRQEVKDPVLRL